MHALLKFVHGVIKIICVSSGHTIHCPNLFCSRKTWISILGKGKIYIGLSLWLFARISSVIFQDKLNKIIVDLLKCFLRDTNSRSDLHGFTKLIFWVCGMCSNNIIIVIIMMVKMMIIWCWFDSFILNVMELWIFTQAYSPSSEASSISFQ